MKDNNVYLGVKLCLAENNAEEIMKTQITRGTTASENFLDTIKMNVKKSTTIDCELIDFLSCVNSPEYIAIPVISVENTENGGGSDESSAENEQPEIAIKSTGIVKQGKVLETQLDNDESEGVAWLTKKAENSDFTVLHNGEDVSVRLSQDGTGISLENENGKLVYKAKIKVVANPSKDIVTKEESDDLSEEVEKRLEKITSKAVQKAMYENKADIFGIWKLLRHSYPESYLDYCNRLDEIYDNVEFEVGFDIRVQ